MLLPYILSCISGHLDLLSFVRWFYYILQDVNTIAQVFKDMAKWEDQKGVAIQSNCKIELAIV